MSSLPPPPPPPAGLTSFPEQAYDGRGERAGFGIRLGSRIIDGILYGLLMAPFTVAAFAMGAGAVKDCSSSTEDGVTEITCTGDQLNGGLLFGAIAVGAIGLIVVAVIYLRQLGRTGQTWGRKMLNIRVVDINTGQPIGIGRAFGRTLFENTISGWLCWLGFFWMLWDKEQQTWHDKIVSSIVVRD